jgi:hypothetical protein
MASLQHLTVVIISAIVISHMQSNAVTAYFQIGVAADFNINQSK